MSEAHPERSEQKIRIFKDPECRNPMYVITFEEPITVGETGEKIVYAKNITNEELVDIKVESENPDVKPEIANTKLMPQESTSVKITATSKELKPIMIKLKFSGRAIARGLS